MNFKPSDLKPESLAFLAKKSAEWNCAPSEAWGEILNTASRKILADQPEIPNEEGAA